MKYDPLENHLTQRALVKANQDRMYQKDTIVGRAPLTKSEVSAFGDAIEKGEISDALVSGYGPGSQAMTFNKTGKEIKEKAPEILTALSIQKATIEAQLAMYSEGAGVSPTNPTSRRYDKSVPFFRYDWGFCEPKYLGEGNYEEKTPQMDLCNKYNSLIYVYCDVLDDIDAINIIVQNVEDTKKYSLSVSQLIALHFTGKKD